MAATCFNPLNQVYRLNWKQLAPDPCKGHTSFNPLNQVYRLNAGTHHAVTRREGEGFNPLNQVYRLNVCDREITVDKKLREF